MPQTGSGVGTPITPVAPPAGVSYPAQSAPLLPLELWRDYFQYHPYHFWGLSESALVPVLSSCNTLVKQYAWQAADLVGRSEIMRAIQSAEEKIKAHAGFWPAPRYGSEKLAYPRFHDRAYTYGASIDGDGRWISALLKDKYIQAFGIEAFTTIDAGAAVSYSDTDGDGVNDTWTATAPTSVTTPLDIAVYFAAADRLNGEGVGERWRIAPVTVSISGGTVTVRGRAWTMVKPILYEGLATQPLNPLTAGNFISTVAIYRRYTNPNGTTNDTAQSLFEWETEPYPQWALGCGGQTWVPGNSSTDPAAVAYAIGRVGIRDGEIGAGAAGVSIYDATSGTWAGVDWATCRQPDRITFRHLSGLPLGADGWMQDDWRRVVARLAAAEMTRQPCACDAANRELYTWQFDVSRAAGANDEQYAVSREDITNPFGTRRGHIEGWRKVRYTRVLRGTNL